MPKKFKGENSKAVVAKERKATARAEAESAKQKALEDEYWRDDDKHVQRKQQRKDDKEKKRLEQLQRKKEKMELLEQELSSIKSAKPQQTAKVTRHEIEANKEKLLVEAAIGNDSNERRKDSESEPIEANINRLTMDCDEARTVDEAISVLGSGQHDVDQHPEKRMKAAFKAYEEKNLPLLKSENPNMRLSQLKQMLKKDWMKSADNPMIKYQLVQAGKS